MNASEARAHDLLAWLFARQRLGVKPGLERPRALLREIGDPQRRFESVLVGGTNGKGSTVSTLSEMLNASGRHTARFISPHLTAFAERFVVGGEGVAPGEVVRALEEIRPAIEKTEATFFEAAAALACLLFAQADADIAVMEVGLGGRFDATNVLEPELSVITGISRDHTQILGETVGEIAAEKAGIMRAGRVCLTGARGDALATLQAQAEEKAATLWSFEDELSLEYADLGWQGLEVEVSSPHGTLRLCTPLLGVHQARNVALAAVAAQHLGAEAEAVQRGAARTRWAGRLEPLLYRGRTMLLDGAHNEEAAHALARTLRTLGTENALLIFGVATGKAVEAMSEALSGVVREVILTKPALSPRAAEPEALAALWDVPTALSSGPREALELALTKSQPGEIIVVAGSLYLIGEVRPLLLGEDTETWERFQ